MKRVATCFFAAVFLFGLWIIPALAADPTAEIDQLKGEVNKLLQRIQDLEKKQAESETKAKEAEKVVTEIKQEEAKLKEDKKQRAIAYYRDGFFIETPDKRFRLQMAGVLHFDTRIFGGETASPSSFDIRRARYDMRGTHYREGGSVQDEFRLQLEMADSPLLRNAYWIFRFMPELNLQLGQFKVPSGGADWLTEEAHVNFIEYATDTPVTPFFDRGFNIISSFLGGKIQTSLAMVTGVGMDTDVGTGDYDNHKDIAARILVVPFKDKNISWLKGMHFAAGYQNGLQSIQTRRGETSMRTENFESSWFKWKPTKADLERRERYGGEFHWIWGPLSTSYEFNRVQWQNIEVFEVSNKPVTAFKLTGAHEVDVHQVWVSYFLTGEQKVFEDVFFAWRQPKPNKNFNLKDGTWGAWELIARYSYKTADQELFDSGILDGSRTGHSVTAGIRWLWNPKVRIMFDYNHLRSESGDGVTSGIITTSADRTKGTFDKSNYQKEENAWLMRFILTL